MMRVYLHIGSGKTGTSVIQSTLARSRAALFKAGLSYPQGSDTAEARAMAGELNQGNGGLLARYVFPGRHAKPLPREDVTGWLGAAVTDAAGRDLVISTEALQFIPREALAELDEMFRAHRYELRVIFYMRHILDVQVSAFAQFAKAGLVATLPPARRTLDGFVATSSTRWPEQLQMMKRLLGAERVMSRLYDADRADLVRNFLGLIGADYARALPSDPVKEVVNRSPNAAEFEVFQAVNGMAETNQARRLCRAISNALLNAPPVVEAPPLHVSQEAYDLFAASTGAVVDAVNKDHLPPETPLKLTSGRTRIGAAEPIEPAWIAQVAAAALIRLTETAPSPAKPTRVQPAIMTAAQSQ